ncbi:major facilitator superfamily protein [Flexivirga endophytica]|uniref:Major facilitator superfamily protein n=1 Tax=Flexivirga endophytica TaxID=1849103 RepID=A0A916T3B2_9MICO|nr:MFS transporter [Flexivirga endophytica]GGB29415.1 major facilitator superfamily protein [Flexivirga endophytica]GHB50501.1 major facilitator superfamily protein [Flexivirga endophytica]
MQSPNPEVAAPGRHAKALLATASVAVALAAADTYVVVLALQDMMNGVGLGVDALQKATPIISGFLLGYIAVLPLIGRLADLIDRQRILIGCLGLFVIGSAVTAISAELPVMVAGRFLQGVGGGGLVPATLALVADLWPPGKRGTPLGVVGAVQEIGSVVGPLLGALVLAVSDWRMIFWLNGLAGIVLALGIVACGGRRGRDRVGAPVPQWWRALTWLAVLVAVVLLGLALWAPDSLTTSIRWGGPFVPYGDHTAHLMTPIGVWGLFALAGLLALSVRFWWPIARSVDVVGALLIAVALGALVLTFAASNPEKQVVGPMGWWLLPVAALAAALYVWRHRAARNPLIAKGVVVGRVRPALVVSLCVGTAIVAVVVDIPVLARLTVTDSQTEAALVLLRFLVAVPVGALAGGWMLRRFGAAVIAAPGLLITSLALFQMSTWGTDALDSWLLPTTMLVLAGLGVGLAIAPVNDAALHDAPQTAHGVVSSLLVVARMVGMVVGLALLTAIGLHRFYGKVQSLPHPTEAQVTEAGVLQVQTVFLGAALVALVAAAVALLLGMRVVGVADADEEDGTDAESDDDTDGSAGGYDAEPVNS